MKAPVIALALVGSSMVVAGTFLACGGQVPIGSTSAEERGPSSDAGAPVNTAEGTCLGTGPAYPAYDAATPPASGPYPHTVGDPEWLASVGEDWTGQVVLDDDNVYIAPEGDGMVRMISKHRAAAVGVQWTWSSYIAQNASNIYLTLSPVYEPVDGAPGYDGGVDTWVTSVPKTGCQQTWTRIAPNLYSEEAGIYGLGGIAVDDTSVYWQGNEGVFKAPLGGGLPTLFAGNVELSATSYRNVLVASGFVYFNSTAGVMRTSIATGTTALFASSPVAVDGGESSSTPVDLAADATNIYYSTIDGRVIRAPMDGSSQAVLVEHAVDPAYLMSRGFSLAVVGGDVYWLRQSNVGGSILKIPSGGGAATVLVDGQSPGGAIAVDATDVYWTADSWLKRIAR